MHLPSVFRLDLRRLILLFAVTTALLTLANTFYASYLAQRDLLIRQTLETNRVYAAKLADSTEGLLNLARQQLAYSVAVLAPVFDQPQKLAAETERLKTQTSIFNSTYVVRADRCLLAISPQALAEPGSVIDSDGAREAVATRQPLVSQPFVSAIGRLVISVSHPVFATEGRYLGYVGGSIYLRDRGALDVLLSDHHYRDGSSLFVVDRQRRILYHHDAERIGEIMPGNPVIEAAISGDAGAQRVTDTDGVDMLTGYASVTSTGWGIVAQRPTEATLAKLHGLMLEILGNSLPVSLLTLLCIWWLSRLIARPLWRLASSARQMDSQAAAEDISQVSSWYFEAAELKRAMLAGLAQFNHKIGQLNHDSITDPLTGLLNRRGMLARLGQWQAGNRPFAVIAIDIDHFKQVNDSLGHEAGDQMLRQLAQLMEQVARSNDVLCRNGGEEFIALLPETSLADACAVAERLRQCVADSPIPEGMSVTISLGVAHCPASSAGIEHALKQADQALYVAKHQGRNRVVTAGAA